MTKECAHKNTFTFLEPQGVKLLKCNDCGLIFSEKIYEDENFDVVYENYYKKGNANRFGGFLEKIVYGFRYMRALKIKKLNKGYLSILDVGCGRGFMLSILKKRMGFNIAEGTQLERNALEYATKNLGLKVYNQDLPNIDFKGSKYDVITYWHVLEHLKFPQQHIKLLKDLLNEKGTIVIEVPNIESWTTKLTGKYCLGLDPKHHLYFFSKKTLSQMLENYGLESNLKTSFSLEYSTFTSTQSLINYITRTNSVLFYWLQKKVPFKLSILLHIFLFTILAPVCLLINLIIFRSNYGEVLSFRVTKK